MARSSKEIVNASIPLVEALSVEIQVSSTPTKKQPLVYGVTLHPVNENRVKGYLDNEKWPSGLRDSVVDGLKRVPLRYFICDDSGSMNEGDGNRLVNDSRGNYSFVKTTRWAELVHALRFHIGLAEAAETETEFRLLNSSRPIKISPDFPENANILRNCLEESPGGATPLCRHIREVITDIRRYEPTLRAHNQRACVIIATDGESSDGEISEALKPLESLPCWVVIRLCTNDEKVVNYWNSIDQVLELEMDVLDDFEAEAKEVYEKNPWLTYGEPLHRVREFGVYIKAFDLIDEKSLTGDNISTVASVILGGKPENYPSPNADMKEFLNFVRLKQIDVSKTWDPLTKKLSPWIRPKELVRAIHGGGVCSLM